MMIQEILTWTTVTGAIIYTLYSFWKNLFAKSSNSLCGGGCSHCEAKNLLTNKIIESQKNQAIKPFATLPPHTFRDKNT